MSLRTLTTLYPVTDTTWSDEVKFLKKPVTEAVKADVLSKLLAYEPRLKDQVVCDFCGSDQPVYVYAATRMSTGASIQCWRWCACTRCDQLIEAEQWQELRGVIKERTAALAYATLGEQVDETALRAVVARVFDTFLHFAIRM